MIIATEKLGCSSLEKYNFERTDALIHAGPPKENFPG